MTKPYYKEYELYMKNVTDRFISFTNPNSCNEIPTYIRVDDKIVFPNLGGYLYYAPYEFGVERPHSEEVREAWNVEQNKNALHYLNENIRTYEQWAKDNICVCGKLNSEHTSICELKYKK